MSATGEPTIYLNPLYNHPLTEAPSGEHQVPESFHTTELSGVSPKPNHYSPRTGSLITQLHIQQSSPGFTLHITNKTRPAHASIIHLVTSVGYT